MASERAVRHHSWSGNPLKQAVCVSAWKRRAKGKQKWHALCSPMSNK